MNRGIHKEGFMQGGPGLAYLGSFLGLLAFVKAIIPRESWYLIQSFLNRVLAWASIYADFFVYEYDGDNSNEIYDTVEQHVATLTSSNSLSSPRRLNLSQLKNAAKPIYGLADGESVLETFQGVSFWWMHRIKELEQSRSLWSRSSEKRYYKLTVHRRYRLTVLPAYLEYIAKHAKELKHQNRDKMLYTNTAGGHEDRGKPWRGVPFKHPATFETMALHPELKQTLTEDLKAFMVGEAFYNRVGRAWKRGYLLYGPPGTGKSSLISAIANFTGYDIYDLELTEVKSNAELRKLLMRITNKSIIVIEDIDCSLDLKKRGKPAPDVPDKKAEDGSSPPGKKDKEEDEKSRVTLSGLLNFTDGLWSCCGSERIIIFTTNHKEKLDSALLRTGRMDLHIHMSYCSFPAFKVLAWTHLGLREDELFGEIEELMGSVQITPADVAEVLIQNKSNAKAALQSLIVALKEKPTSESQEAEKEQEGESRSIADEDEFLGM